MSDENLLQVRDHLKTRPWIIMLMPAFGILLDQLASLNNPIRTPLKVFRQPGAFMVYGRFLFLHLYIFELLTTVLLWIFLQHIFVKIFNLKSVKLTLKSIILYDLKMLPAILIGIVIVAPVSNGLKYLLVGYPNYNWASYWPQWFMTDIMYFNYLLPVLVASYLMLGINMLLSFTNRRQAKKVKASYSYTTKIKATNKSGTTAIDVEQVFWFEVKNKTYYAYTPEPCQINIKLTELEVKLDPEMFFRINRSQIINVLKFDAYTYWEHDKYIVKLKGHDDDFIITRTKLLVLKAILKIG